MKNLIVFLLALCTFFISGCASERSVSTGIVHSLDGTPIYYQSYGDGPVTLVFVHGWSCDTNYWKKQVEYFQDKYQVVTIDLAGHGLSGKSRESYTVEAYAGDVKSVLKHVTGPVILIGHSMAGEIIVESAPGLEARVKALIGVDTLQDVSAEVTEAQVEQYLKIFDGDFEEGVSTFVSGMFGPNDSPALKDSIIKDMASADPEIATNTLKNYFDYHVSGKAREAAKKVRIPTYCINADLWPTNIEGNKSIFPRYISCEIISDSGHFIMLSNSEEFNTKLESIIKSIEK